VSSSPRVDALVIGAGPAALAIASSLGEQGLQVEALAAQEPDAAWTNTYGIWGEEVDRLGLGHLLGHRWSNTLSYFGSGEGGDNRPIGHGRDYGLFNSNSLQQHWLDQTSRCGLGWQRGVAAAIEHGPGFSRVVTAAGKEHRARLVIDASGHEPIFVQRPSPGKFSAGVASQAAYGIVAGFSAPPVEPGQFVLMDYRCDHLTAAERSEPPSFLYAMDLGGGQFFVEETSLALAPALSFGLLKRRLQRRLAHRGVTVGEIQHEEFCLFPMNPPLPDRHQRVLGFGGAASMVHPASGYMVGALLRRAPGLATAIAKGLDSGVLTSSAASDALSTTASAAAWEALWPMELRRKHGLYRFGLEKLMRFSEAQLRQFFASFFELPGDQWYGFLANTLPLPQLLEAMLGLFATAPQGVRWGLMQPRGRELALLARLMTG